VADDVSGRELRENATILLRRVAAGERFRVTVHGRPVAELVPIERAERFVPFQALVSDLHGTLPANDRPERKLRGLDDAPRDPFA
jgi:prevent-host-death family protein